MIPRRTFLHTALGATAWPAQVPRGRAAEGNRTTPERLQEVADTPVLQVEGLARPVTIATMDLLRNRREFLVRVRAKDRAEGLAVANSMHLIHTYRDTSSLMVENGKTSYRNLDEPADFRAHLGNIVRARNQRCAQITRNN